VQLHWLTNQPSSRGGPRGAVANAVFAVGSALLVWSSYIHFHLWLSGGYRHIPTIGDLFLLQAILGTLIALGALITRRIWFALLAAGFALSTLVGFLLSVNIGLFGFRDSASAPFAHEAFILEIGSAVAYLVAAALCGQSTTASRHRKKLQEI